MSLSDIHTVGVIGAGTMGAGIAQVAAQTGYAVMLYDISDSVVQTALDKLRATLQRLVEKGRMTTEALDALMGRISPTSDLAAMKDAQIVIEAAPERLDLKQRIFGELADHTALTTILATNTSTLSVTQIAAGVKHPERVVGMHFFNPAPLLPLVEVITGAATAPEVAKTVVLLAEKMGKHPVRAHDVPGFIVNRVARPFYGEAIRIYEEGIADMYTIDAAMKSVGFKMGPFELMDLIGNDINFTVTKTVWEAFFYDPRYKPSFTQQRQVESGRLGRKSGRGYYQYDTSGAILPQTSVGSIAGSPPSSGDPAEVSAQIVERILAMLLNEAYDALFWQVASANDIDLAMTKGVNYPKGLLAWSEEKGAAHWLDVLEGLQARYGEDRYRPSLLLRRRANG